MSVKSALDTDLQVVFIEGLLVSVISQALRKDIL